MEVITLKPMSEAAAEAIAIFPDLISDEHQ
jgi:hypothetical protein